MYSADITNYFLASTHNRMEAEDMTHDLFVRLMTMDSIDSQSLKALVFTIAKHMVIDNSRHNLNVRKYSQYCQKTACGVDNSVEDRIDSIWIRKYENECLKNLPTRRAQVYTMYFQDEMSAKEISETLSLSLRTVEGHIYMSRMKMKKYLRNII